jgi:hypothetical protein
MIISIVFAFMFFIQGDGPDQKMSPKFSDSISILFEEMFSPASNSSSHYIVNEKDLKKLKYIVQSHSDSTDLIVNSVLLNNQLKSDSLKNSIKSVDSLTQILNEKLVVENRNYQTNQASIFGIFFSIAALVILLFFLSTAYFRIKEKFKFSSESLAEVEKNFDAHKKNAIDRERKLMRELIDLKNKLEIKI